MMWIDLAVIGAWIAPAFTPASALAMESSSYSGLFRQFFPNGAEWTSHRDGLSEAGTLNYWQGVRFEWDPAFEPGLEVEHQEGRPGRLQPGMMLRGWSR